MKTIYYIGCYCGNTTGKRQIAPTNLAGTVKMEFIINAVKKIGYSIIVVSIAPDKRTGYYSLETVCIDAQEVNVYIPSLRININGHSHGYKFSKYFLQKYLEKHLSKSDVVVSYHSLGYTQMISSLHKKIGFRWIPQIEEIYCLSRCESKDLLYLQTEERMFDDGDGYLFVNDLLPQKYANNKPFAVSYGNYHVCDRKQIAPNKDIINITYTGIINDDRGVFTLLEAMRFLPSKYRLNILGFGTDENMIRLHQTIENVNKLCKADKIVFCGTRSGKEYSEFLLSNQIGISLMEESEDTSTNAFPSKIMSYLGHSLYVVTSRVKSIECSKVASLLYFCNNTPEDVARAIQSIPVMEKNDNAKIIRKLEEDFLVELKGVLQ